jgi:hypothetical protein
VAVWRVSVAHKICDKKPCDELVVALRTYLYALPPTNPDAGFVAIRAESKFTTTPARTYEERISVVALRYCPFCGTRIGFGMTEWVGPPPKGRQVAPTPRLDGVKLRRL